MESLTAAPLDAIADELSRRANAFKDWAVNGRDYKAAGRWWENSAAAGRELDTAAAAIQQALKCLRESDNA